MNKLLIAFLLVILSSFNLIHAQSQEDLRNQVLNEKADFLKLGKDKEYLNTKLYILVNDELDSVDMEILGPSAGMNLVMKSLESEDDDTITFRTLYDEMVFMKQTMGKYYHMTKERYLTLRDWLKLPADPANWETDRQTLTDLIQLMESAGEDASELIYVEAHIPKFASPNMTYKEVMELLKQEELREGLMNRQSMQEELSELLKNDKVIYFEHLLIVSKLERQPVLIYFTGYNCVNCRKLEESVLKDPEIVNSLLDDFIVVPVYVDSQKELKTELKGTCTIDGREYDIETVGDYNRCFQFSEFNLMSQPFLVFMNSEGEILSTADYEHNSSVESMKKVLDEVLEKFYE